MKKKGAPRRILYKWFISYIVILIITLIISSTVYVKSVNIINDYIDKSAIDALDQYRTYVEERLKDMERLSIEIGLDENVRSILWSNEPLKADQVFIRRDIRNTLSSYKLANSFIDTVFIYFNHHKQILSYMGVYDGEDWYDTYLKKYSLSNVEFNNILDSKASSGYKILSGGVSQDYHKIYLVNPLYSFDGYDIRGKLVISINQENITGALTERNKTKNSVMFAIDENNNVIFKNNNLNTGFVNYNDIISGKSTIENDDIEYIMNSLPSDIADWKYVSLIPADVFSDRLGYVRNITLLSVFATIVVVFLVSYVFSVRNYKPVDKLLSLFDNDTDKKGKKDEYKYIEQSIQNIINEKEEITSQLHRQEETLKRFFLLRLINGSIKSESLARNLCDRYKLHFADDSYQLLLFYIEDAPMEFLKKGNMEISFMETMESIIQNIIDNNILKKYNTHVIQIEDMIACLITSSHETFQKNKNYTDETAKMWNEIALEHAGIKLSISISEVHEGLLQMKKAYREAMEGLEYIKLIGLSQVISFNDMKRENTDFESVTGTSYTRLKNFIISNDFSNAKKELDTIFNVKMFKEASSLQMIKIKIFSFIDILLTALSEISISSHYGLLENSDFTGRLLNCSSVTELKKEAESIFDMISEQIRTHEDGRDFNLYENVRNYIAENYVNKDLSVASIADNFKISNSYLSRYFKKESGIVLSEYIQQVRLNSAKELLCNKSNLSLNDIADQTGFYNSIALIRIFKKYEGITPGKFREIQ